MNANELAREIWKQAIVYDSHEQYFEDWASTPEAKSLISQLSGVGGMKWVALVRKAREFIREYVGDECTDSDYHDMVREMDDALSESPIPSGEQDGGWKDEALKGLGVTKEIWETINKKGETVTAKIYKTLHNEIPPTT